jgi:hypothetical protein
MLSKRTSEYRFGGALLFDRDDFAPEVMCGHCPVPSAPEGCNEVFDRTAAQFREAFGFARRLGVKTCIGTETPLIQPAALQARVKAQGKDPQDPATVRAIYEGTFRRIMASHALDYYWIWTPEDWTWGGNKPEQYAATVRDLKLAYEALKKAGAPFELATCGWVLGPQHDRAALDVDLPKDVPDGCRRARHFRPGRQIRGARSDVRPHRGDRRMAAPADRGPAVVALHFGHRD